MTVRAFSATLYILSPLHLTVKTAIQEYSDASEIPVNASLINVDLNCSESGSPCSLESTCLEGDLGVYCHCYTQYSTSEEVRGHVAVCMEQEV